MSISLSGFCSPLANEPNSAAFLIDFYYYILFIYFFFSLDLTKRIDEEQRDMGI